MMQRIDKIPNPIGVQLLKNYTASLIAEKPVDQAENKPFDRRPGIINAIKALLNINSNEINKNHYEEIIAHIKSFEHGFHRMVHIYNQFRSDCEGKNSDRPGVVIQNDIETFTKSPLLALLFIFRLQHAEEVEHISAVFYRQETHDFSSFCDEEGQAATSKKGGIISKATKYADTILSQLIVIVINQHEIIRHFLQANLDFFEHTISGLLTGKDLKNVLQQHKDLFMKNADTYNRLETKIHFINTTEKMDVLIKKQVAILNFLNAPVNESAIKKAKHLSAEKQAKEEQEKIENQIIEKQEKAKKQAEENQKTTEKQIQEEQLQRDIALWIATKTKMDDLSDLISPSEWGFFSAENNEDSSLTVKEHNKDKKNFLK